MNPENGGEIDWVIELRVRGGWKTNMAWIGFRFCFSGTAGKVARANHFAQTTIEGTSVMWKGEDQEGRRVGGTSRTVRQ